MSNAEPSPGGYLRKIALEEHFVTPELAKYGASGVAVTSDYGHDRVVAGSLPAVTVATRPEPPDQRAPKTILGTCKSDVPPQANSCMECQTTALS
jgi:hypothetical protein